MCGVHESERRPIYGGGGCNYIQQHTPFLCQRCVFLSHVTVNKDQQDFSLLLLTMMMMIRSNFAAWQILMRAMEK